MTHTLRPREVPLTNTTQCNLCRDECLGLVQVDKCINTCNQDLNCRIGQFDRGDGRGENNGNGNGRTQREDDN